MSLGLRKLDVFDLTERTQWYAFVRLLFLLAIGVPGIFTLYLFEGFSDQTRSGLTLLGIGLLSNLVFYVLTQIHKNRTYLKYLCITLILLDILLITFLIYTKGGIESRSPILFTIPILISAALFGRRASYMTALLSSSVYVLLIVADYANIIHSTGAYDPSVRTNLAYVINTIVFFPAILLIIALAVDFMTKLLLEKQRQATDNLDALIRAQEIAKLGSWEWDIARDKIAWSDELFRIFGLPLNTQLHFDTYLRCVHPEDSDELIRVVNEAVENGTSYAIDHRIVTADNHTKYIHSEGRPVEKLHGRVTKIAGTAQDITEIHELDIAKREFVSLASHQLRTPASGVKAFLSLLMDGFGDNLDKKQQTFIKRAFEANNRQLEIIDNLLSLASIDSGKLTLHTEQVDLHKLIRACLSQHRPKLREKKQRLTLGLANHPILLEADPGNLQMAIDNLISNAIKYTPEKGDINIVTRATKHYAYIEVIDSGIGISKEDLPVLFRKFSRINNPASRTVGGSGLGLYVAKYIVQLHGGTISVRSHNKHGSRFTIKLPLNVQRA